MPGAHGQFQYWFTMFVPIALGMTGVPVVCTFWVYSYFYPHENYFTGDPAPQHQFLLALCAWLLVVGPCDNLAKTVWSLLTCQWNKEEKPPKKIKGE